MLFISENFNSICGILALCRESKLNLRMSKLISFTKWIQDKWS